MGIVIRMLEERDIEAVSEIEADSFSMPWSPSDFADLLKRSYCIYLVAESEGRIVGSAGMTVVCDEGNIDNVVVGRMHRGQGIAQQMLAKLIEIGEAQGIGAFTLEVRVSNAAAIHVYSKAGFVSEGIRPNFYEKPREDAMIMWRRKNKKW